MLSLEKTGKLTEEEYATYCQVLLKAVELLKAATAFNETPGDLSAAEASNLKSDLGAFCQSLEDE